MRVRDAKDQAGDLDFGAAVTLESGAGVSIARQIALGIEQLIDAGVLGPGARLPAQKAMAHQIGVHFRTVGEAYRHLETRGLIEQTQGRGTFVTQLHTARFRVVALMPPWEEVKQSVHSNHDLHAFLAGMESFFAGQRFSLSILTLPTRLDDPAQCQRWADRIKANYDGLLNLIFSLTPLMEKLVADDFPVVTYYNVFEVPQVTQVHFNRQQSTYLAADHLAKSGRRRIGFLGRGRADRYASAGFEGYFSALVDNGCVYDPALTFRCEQFHSGLAWETCLKQAVLAGGCRGDAFVADCRGAAYWALRVFKQAGKSIPEEIALVGFDDVALATESDPCLTWIEVPRFEMGRCAASHLAKQLLSGRSTAGPVVVEPQLVLGRSCGVAQGDGRLPTIQADPPFLPLSN